MKLGYQKGWREQPADEGPNWVLVFSFRLSTLKCQKDQNPETRKAHNIMGNSSQSSVKQHPSSPPDLPPFLDNQLPSSGTKGQRGFCPKIPVAAFCLLRHPALFDRDELQCPRPFHPSWHCANNWTRGLFSDFPQHVIVIIAPISAASATIRSVCSFGSQNHPCLVAIPALR